MNMHEQALAAVPSPHLHPSVFRSQRAYTAIILRSIGKIFIVKAYAVRMAAKVVVFLGALPGPLVVPQPPPPGPLLQYDQKLAA